MSLLPRYIVAEVSKNWLNGMSVEDGVLAERFELVIAHNLARGYRLHSFQLHRLMTGPGELNETIIAVFQRQADVAHFPTAPATPLVELPGDDFKR